MTRRNNTTFAAIAVALAIGSSLACIETSLASAPMVKSQAPGYYRMMLGDFEITALSDGTVKMPMDQLLKEPPERTKALLARSYETVPLETSVNGYLINTGDKLILIDTGAAGFFGPTLGNLVSNLKAAGYQPEQVDDIYLTHLHPDHVGGLMIDGVMSFPNATVHVDQRDVDFWLNGDHLEQAPAANKGFYEGDIASVEPYVKAGRLETFNGSTELSPGISTISTYGHTAGHTSYLIQSKGERLLVTGDLVHVAAVQMMHPTVTIGFDSDTKQAAIERRRIFNEAAKQGEWIAAAHLSFPGIGHLRIDGKGYEFLPINYSGLK